MMKMKMKKKVKSCWKNDWDKGIGRKKDLEGSWIVYERGWILLHGLALLLLQRLESLGSLFVGDFFEVFFLSSFVFLKKEA